MESVEKRINRIIGQLKGIEKMVTAQRTSVEILQQISAIKKAVDGLTLEIAQKDIAAGRAGGQQEFVKILKTLIRL